MNYCADCPLYTLDSTAWDQCLGLEGSCHFQMETPR